MHMFFKVYDNFILYPTHVMPGRETGRQNFSNTLQDGRLDKECHEEAVQHYRNTDYKPMMINIRSHEYDMLWL